MEVFAQNEKTFNSRYWRETGLIRVKRSINGVIYAIFPNFWLNRMVMTNQYKTKNENGNIIWALQSNAPSDIFCGNCTYFEWRKNCMFNPQR
jgi:hypothetical protein